MIRLIFNLVFLLNTLYFLALTPSTQLVVSMCVNMDGGIFSIETNVYKMRLILFSAKNWGKRGSDD